MIINVKVKIIQFQNRSIFNKLIFLYVKASHYTDYSTSHPPWSSLSRVVLYTTTTLLHCDYTLQSTVSLQSRLLDCSWLDLSSNSSYQYHSTILDSK